MHKTRRKKRIQTTFIGLFIIATFSACVRNEQPAEGDSSKQTASNISAPDSIDVVFLVPSPGEILDRIYNADINYDIGFINPVENRKNYLDSYSQALNLGVYFSDMAYLTLFETRVSETVNYMETIQSLSYEVGISTSVFGSLIERARSNSGNMDSLYVISNEAYTDLLDFLEFGGKENTVVLISAGAFIESLYLAVNSIGEYSEENDIADLITELKYPLENLLEKAGQVKEDAGVKRVMDKLNPVYDVFKGMKSSSNAISVNNNEDKKKLRVIGGDKPEMTLEDFKRIKALASEIRAEVVGI